MAHKSEDKYMVACLIMVLRYLDIYTLYQEDVDIIVGIHEFGPGFADD